MEKYILSVYIHKYVLVSWEHIVKILLPNEFHGGKGVLMVPHPSLNIALDCSDICGIIGMCMLNLYGFRVSYHP